MLQIKKIHVLSMAKIGAIIYGTFGLIKGIFITINALFLSGPLYFGNIFTIIEMAAVIISPIFHAILGFIIGLISAWVYNKVVKWFGGIQVELTQVTTIESAPVNDASKIV
jgi:hypothetical protein